MKAQINGQKIVFLYLSMGAACAQFAKKMNHSNVKNYSEFCAKSVDKGVSKLTDEQLSEFTFDLHQYGTGNADQISEQSLKRIETLLLDLYTAYMELGMKRQGAKLH